MLPYPNLKEQVRTGTICQFRRFELVITQLYRLPQQWLYWHKCYTGYECESNLFTQLALVTNLVGPGGCFTYPGMGV